MFQDINTFFKILWIPLNEDTCIISKGFRAGFFLGISDSPNVLGKVDFNPKYLDSQNKNIGRNDIPLGTPCSRRIFLVSSQENICFSISKEETYPPSNRFLKVKHLQTIVNVAMG